MSHSKTRLWTHIIFGVKYRQKLITEAIEPIIHQDIREQFVKCGCHVEAINGVEDHVHILIDMTKNKSLASVMKQVKGATARRINELNLVAEGFEWQVGYGAFSIGATLCSVIVNYINKQKLHHKDKTSKEEFNEFLKAYQIEAPDEEEEDKEDKDKEDDEGKSHD